MGVSVEAGGFAGPMWEIEGYLGVVGRGTVGGWPAML